MKFPAFYGLALSLCMFSQAIQAGQDLPLKEVPPLSPLHYCQDSTGDVKAQRDACESGKTEVSSITTIRNGKVIHAPLGETLSTWNPDAKPEASAEPIKEAASSPGASSRSAGPKSLGVFIACLLIASFVVSIIATKHERSGVITFLVCLLGGVLANAMVTAVGGVGTPAFVGGLAVPLIMFLRIR